MTDKAKESATTAARPEDATDDQLEKVAGGGHRERFRDENGNLREGEWGAHHYHEGIRGAWNGGIWIQL